MGETQEGMVGLWLGWEAVVYFIMLSLILALMAVNNKFCSAVLGCFIFEEMLHLFTDLLIVRVAPFLLDCCGFLLGLLEVSLLYLYSLMGIHRTFNCRCLILSIFTQLNISLFFVHL
jgi:hypothetical protein